jgi:class 3 adenylate cyclase
MAALAAVPASEASTAERRQAVILCTRLRGFTRMTDMLEPERVVDMAGEFFSLTQKIVAANEGETLSTQNDTMLATFRHGKPSELVRRAITAAQDVQYGFAPLAEAWHRDFGLPAAIAIGLHLGNVVYGSTGPNGHARFIALGEAVNIAGRLMHRARAGEFLLSDSVMGALLLSNLELDAQPLPALELPRGPSIRIYGVLLDTRLDFT